MSRWLDPVRRALDELPQPVSFFFRDDDAGWNDERLFALLDLFSLHGLPVDVAVIPSELTPRLTRELNRRIAADPQRLHVHQHGFAHCNHETSGRKCEFGFSRDASAQRADIELGRARLLVAFGNRLDPIFTPPWNRCTRTTAECLREIGFQVLSRESSAVPFNLPGLRETPVHVDWFARRHGARLSRGTLGECIAGFIRRQTHVGIMLHHAVMDDTDLAATSNLLCLVSAHRRTQFCSVLVASRPGSN